MPDTPDMSDAWYEEVRLRRDREVEDRRAEAASTLASVEDRAREIRERLGLNDAVERRRQYEAQGEYIREFLHPYASPTGRYLPPPHTTITVNDSSVITACNTSTAATYYPPEDDMPVVTDHTVLDRITTDLRERQQQVLSMVNEALRHARNTISHLEATRDWLAGNDPVTAERAERAKYSARDARDAIGACGRQVTSLPSQLTSVARIATDADNERQRITRERASAELAANIDAMRAAHPGEYIPVGGDEIRVPGLSRHVLVVRMLREGMNDERVSFVIDEPATGDMYTRSLHALRANGMIRASEYTEPEPVAREVIPPADAVPLPRPGDTVIMPHGISGRPGEPSREYEVTHVGTVMDSVHVTVARNGTHWTRDVELLRQRGMRIERDSDLVRAEPVVPADMEPGDRFLLRNAVALDEGLTPSTVFTVQDPWAWMEDGDIRFTDDSSSHRSWEASPDDLHRYGIVTLSDGWLPAQGEIITFTDAASSQYVVDAVTAPPAGQPILRFHLVGGDYTYQAGLSRAVEMGVRRLEDS